MRKVISFSLLLLVGLILIILSISAYPSNETNGNKSVNWDTSFSVSNVTKEVAQFIDYQEMEIKQNTEHVEEQVFYVNATEEEKDLLDNIEITNPKIPYTLGFVSESFTPTEKIDDSLYSKIQEISSLKITNITPQYVKNNYTYGFIMILGKRRESKLNTLENIGVKLLGYHPRHSYKAKIPLNKISELEQLSFVKWVGYSTNKQKFDNTLNAKFDNESDMGEELEIFINLFDDDISDEFKNILKKEGMQKSIKN